MLLNNIPISILFEDAKELAQNLLPTKAVGPTNTFLNRQDNPAVPKNPMFNKLSRFTPAKIEETPTTNTLPATKNSTSNIPNKS